MVLLTFYGGVGKIGGNKILLQDRDTKILLDFGLDFSLNNTYYAWPFFRPRSSHGLHDYLELGLLPRVKGLYREDLLKKAEMEPEEPEVSMVLISHGHMDHVGCVPFIHETIPVAMGEITKGIIGAVSGTRYDLESEFIEVGHSQGGRLEKTEEHPGRQQKEWVSRDIRPFRTGGSITCGPLEIEPVHVDHSIPGAYGFIIHASDATVVYSGDLRLHGSKPQLTREFVEAAAKAKPDVLLIEGTNVGEKKSQGSEDLVKKSLAAAAKGSDKLVLAGFDVKNADRLRSIHEIAQETGRRFVIPLKRAQLYEALANDPQLGLPALASGDPAIYLPRRNFVRPDGTYPIEDFGEDEQELMGRSGVATVTSRDVKAKESEFLMVLDYYEFNELLDLKPTAGSKYLFSKTEPFNEEMEIDFDRTKAWLDKFAFDVRTSHCSGHASRDDLFGIVKDIGAKKVIPIHTEHPAMFSGFPKMTAILGSSIEVKA